MSTFTLGKTLFPLDPGGTGSPHTIQMPETTLLVEGITCGLAIMTGSVTGVTITSHPSSSGDLIVDPTSISSAPASTLSSLNLSAWKNMCIIWVLIKTGVTDPTFQLFIV